MKHSSILTTIIRNMNRITLKHFQNIQIDPSILEQYHGQNDAAVHNSETTRINK